MPADDEPFDDFEIDLAPLWPDEDGRLEPIFFDGPQWIEFSEVEPQAAVLELAADAALLVGLDEFALLEPQEGDEEPDEPPLPTPQRANARSLAVSFGVHLLPLLMLIGWHNAPADFAGAIPVQLVLEAPAAIAEEKAAGDSVAQSSSQEPPADNDKTVSPAEPPPARPAARVASVTPPAKPRPPEPRMQPTAPPTRPAPPTHPAQPAPPRPVRAEAPVMRPTSVAAAAVPPRPAAEPVPTQPAKAEAAVARPVNVVMAPAPPRAVGVSAGSPASSAVTAPREATASSAIGDGDYFARLEQLTRPYLYMLSPSFLAGRRGQTTLTIVVADDGTIGRIGVKRSSGYPDIDARIEQMVAAVGRFPPLPPQLRRPGVDLDFNLVFPQVLQQ